MFLSNPRLILSLILICLTLLQGCSSLTNETTTTSPVGVKGKPFPTKAPETYQGDFVVSNGTDEERYFVARKGDKWRFDTKRDNQPALTQLYTDRVYFIDNPNKSYIIKPYADEKDFDINYFNSLTWGFFMGANYLEFEEIERSNGLVKYKATTYKGTKSDVFVTIDEATGVMVRQEITGKKSEMEEGKPANYIFEVRNLRLDVDDSVFEIPSGFSRATH